MNQKLAINIRGHRHSWSFHFEGDPRDIDEWCEDGLDVVEVVHSIPKWVVDAGLTRLWCFFEDLFRFRNPLREK